MNGPARASRSNLLQGSAYLLVGLLWGLAVAAAWQEGAVTVAHLLGAVVLIVYWATILGGLIRGGAARGVAARVSPE